jgi:CheY-like chemotaxis protein
VIRILVADDNPAVRRYLRGVLEQQEDWQVCDEASDGAEAVQRFQTGHHDVIVLDFQMPQMNGLEVAQQIKKLSRFLWSLCIFLSSWLWRPGRPESGARAPRLI